MHSSQQKHSHTCLTGNPHLQDSLQIPAWTLCHLIPLPGPRASYSPASAAWSFLGNCSCAAHAPQTGGRHKHFPGTQPVTCGPAPAAGAEPLTHPGPSSSCARDTHTGPDPGAGLRPSSAPVPGTTARGPAPPSDSRPSTTSTRRVPPIAGTSSLQH